jgi:hypothetical protein
MHIILILLHAATFQQLASAAADPSPPSSIWETPYGSNYKPYFLESDFRTATGYTADSMAEKLSSTLKNCFEINNFKNGQLVLTPRYSLVPQEKTKAFQDAVTKAVNPLFHTLAEMINLCKLKREDSITEAAVDKLQTIALGTVPPPISEPDKTKINFMTTSFLDTQWNKCVGKAWGMIAEQGSIAIEPPMGIDRNRDYFGQLNGLKAGLRIPVYKMEEDQFGANKPQYTLIQNQWYSHQG